MPYIFAVFFTWIYCQQSSINDRCADLLRTLSLLYTRKAVSIIQAKQKRCYDKRTKVRRFQPGDKVLVLLQTDTNKLLLQWKGPYDITRVVSPNDYKVLMKGKEKTLHANLLKK